AAARSSWADDATGLHHTYGEDFDGIAETCNGDLHQLLEGRHAELTARMLATDLDAVLDLTQPADVYTHVGFDGHPDHAEVPRLGGSRRAGAARARPRRGGRAPARRLLPPGVHGRRLPPARRPLPHPPPRRPRSLPALPPRLEPPPPATAGVCDPRRGRELGS